MLGDVNGEPGLFFDYLDGGSAKWRIWHQMV